MKNIQAAMLRVRQVLRLKPERGRRTVTTTVVVGEGLRCDVIDGAWSLPVDMTVNTGGEGSAPDPGVYARTAIGACVAIAYRMWAAAEGLHLQDVRVDIEADNDASGLFGVGSARPAYREVRLRVRVASDAPIADVERVLSLAEAHSPYLDLFRHGVPVRVSRTITPSLATTGVQS